MLVAARDAKYDARDDVLAPPLAELAALDDAAFRLRYSGSPIKRIGRDRFVRNVLIAAGNSEQIRLLPLIEALLSEPSPLVRAMAVWALSQLHDEAGMAAVAAKYRPSEIDPDVQGEWSAATPS